MQSFKVICIKDDNQNRFFISGDFKPDNTLSFGKIYTVVDERPSFVNPRYNVYMLAEHIGGFWTGYFSPLSGPCEKKILEERADQEIANLDRNYRDLVHEVETA